MDERKVDGTYPVYVRGWENYPSGRRYERITRLEKGRQVSVTKITDANGFVEYSLTTRDEAGSDDVFAAFETQSFGYGRSTPSHFKALATELIRLSAACRK